MKEYIKKLQLNKVDKRKLDKDIRKESGGGIDDVIEQFNSLKLTIQAASNTTISTTKSGNVSVPKLTVDQVTKAYNQIVSGGTCIITDATGNYHLVVNQADALNGSPAIRVIYYNNICITYEIERNDVNINFIESPNINVDKQYEGVLCLQLGNDKPSNFTDIYNKVRTILSYNKKFYSVKVFDLNSATYLGEGTISAMANSSGIRITCASYRTYENPAKVYLIDYIFYADGRYERKSVNII